LNNSSAPLARRGQKERFALTHARAAAEGFAHLWQNLLASAIGVAVMALTLALPALLALLLENQRTLAKDWGDAASLTVFVRPGTPLEAAQASANQLATDGDVDKVEVIEAKAAFAEFRAASGMDGGLDIDPLLPHVLIVTPAVGARSQEAVNRASKPCRILTRSPSISPGWTVWRHSVSWLAGVYWCLRYCLLARRCSSLEIPFEPWWKGTKWSSTC
jgi:hypothetical protein